MRGRSTVLVFSLLIAAAAVSPAASAGTEETKMGVLDTLSKRHPRILATEDDWARIASLIATDTRAGKMSDYLYERAERLLSKPPTEHKLVGPRLLQESRRCVDRVYTLATIYKVTGERRFAERAVREMLAAAAFPDWNPPHFLDTAEMTHALAVGYDWLFDELSENERAKVRTAIVEKGLRPALPLYEDDSWQVACDHNWNQVCNGGLAIGALAIADEEPELAARIIENAVRLLPNAVASYAPDGGWAEGPGYWGYATRYTCYMLAALESALGHDFGLSGSEGFAATGFFPLHFSGPRGRTFNYADGSDFPRAATHMFYLARRFHNGVFNWYQWQHLSRPEALDLIWYNPDGKGPDEAGVPLDSFYKGIDVAFFRSAWDDGDAVFVGFKGGDNKANHSHLDLGTFVLDALGERWAVDLGPDNYDLPGYFGAQRFDYYRLRTESHNTLAFGRENQDREAAAPIVDFGSTPERAWAIADLTAGYPGRAESVRRGVALLDRSAVLIQDEIDAKSDEGIFWRMLTRAAIEIDGAVAILRQGDVGLEARIIGGDGLEFTSHPASAPEAQRQQPGVTVLEIHIPGGERKHRVCVLLTPMAPGRTAPAEAPAVTPLDEWNARAR
ncbi:MAG: DUF4962 domain-containing protein [Planctomycetota bacterium]|jgi:hypothetical protein